MTKPRRQPHSTLPWQHRFALLAPVVLLAAVPVVLVYDAVRALRGRTTE